MCKDLPVLTNSRMYEARRCLRKHHIAYNLKYRTVKEEEPLVFGTIWHEAQAAWWIANSCSWKDTDSNMTPLDRGLEAIGMLENPNPIHVIMAEELLVGYDVRWGKEQVYALEDSKTKDPLIEVQFRCPLVNPMTGHPSRTWQLGGKLDGIVNMVDPKVGNVWRNFILEHKNTTLDISPGSDYWKRLLMDSQITMYYEGGTSLGYEPEGALYDVVGRPQIRPLKATPEDKRKYRKDGQLYAGQRDQDETDEEYRLRLRDDICADPEKYFQRHIVMRLEEEMRDHLFDFWQTARQIREAELQNRWPRNPDGCERFFRFCEYFDVCTGMGSLDNADHFRKLETEHPELEGSSLM